MGGRGDPTGGRGGPVSHALLPWVAVVSLDVAALLSIRATWVPPSPQGIHRAGGARSESHTAARWAVPKAPSQSLWVSPPRVQEQKRGHVGTPRCGVVLRPRWHQGEGCRCVLTSPHHAVLQSTAPQFRIHVAGEPGAYLSPQDAHPLCHAAVDR